MVLTPGGGGQRGGAAVLQQTVDLLEHIEGIGLMQAISEGTFGRMHRRPDSGKGLAGVVRKAPGYCNPFAEQILPAPAGVEAAGGGLIAD